MLKWQTAKAFSLYVLRFNLRTLILTFFTRSLLCVMAQCPPVFANDQCATGILHNLHIEHRVAYSVRNFINCQFLAE